MDDKVDGIKEGEGMTMEELEDKAFHKYSIEEDKEVQAKMKLGSDAITEVEEEVQIKDNDEYNYLCFPGDFLVFPYFLS